METTVARGEALIQAEREVLGDIWSSSEAYDNLVHLCDRIGDRWAGSDSERQGGAWLRDKAASYGLRNPRLQEFKHLAWTRGPVSLRITTPVQREVAAFGTTRCGAGHPTPNSSVRIVPEASTRRAL